MKRSKTLREAFEEVHYHFQKLRLEIIKVCRIEKILDWLTARLTK